jgi:L-fucose mutarotase
MLKNISPLISPALLENMARMGHGDELILADAHFPGERLNNNIIRADGLKIPDLLKAILPLFELDTYAAHPIIMMEPVKGDVLDPDVEKRYLQGIQLTNPDISSVRRMERFEFYEQAKQAFAVVMTGETAKYGNIILKKGVTPV